MISHITLGVADIGRAVAFYGPLMALLGASLKFHDASAGWAGWQPSDADRPLFIVMRPFDGGPASAGNGAMTAFLAADRATVDAVHAAAMQAGARSEGAPGLRPQYHDRYYGAYFRDPEGNKLAVCCHD